MPPIKTEISDYTTEIREAAYKIIELVEYEHNVVVSQSDAAEICEIIEGCII